MSAITWAQTRGVGTSLEVLRPGRGSGGVTPSGDPRGRAPGGGQGAKPPGSQRFKKNLNHKLYSKLI